MARPMVFESRFAEVQVAVSMSMPVEIAIKNHGNHDFICRLSLSTLCGLIFCSNGFPAISLIHQLMITHFTPQGVHHQLPLRSTSCFLITTPTGHQQPHEELGLWLPFSSGRRWVLLSQILRLEGMGNYTTCYFLDGSELLMALSLKVFAGRVPAGSLVRSHRKHLLNRHYIEAVSAVQLQVLLTNGERVPVARRRVTAFRKAWRG